MSWVIRPFDMKDLDGCQRLMSSNTPRYFAPEESAEFTQDLQQRQRLPESQRWPYFVLVTNQQVRGCGGYAQMKDGTATLIWGMVDSAEHGQGLGRELLRYRLWHMPPSIHSVEIDTTPASFGFYQRFGFVAYQHVPDGYGPGLDKVLARLQR